MNMQSLFITGLFLIVTLGRLVSIVTGIIGLISIFLGRQALVRSAGLIGSKRPKAIAALVTGSICVLLSALHLMLSNADFGTGSGKLGAIVAMVVGLAGTGLGALALARSRRIANGGSSIRE